MIPVFSVLVASSLCAQSMLTYHYGQLTTESKNIMTIQSLGEIVGGNSPYHEIRYGVSSLNTIGATKADAFVFGYYAPDKNREMGFGLGGTLNGTLTEDIPKLTWKIGGKAGYGWQSVKGESKTISTNINKLTYVTSGNYSAYKVPTKMTYEDDTYVLSLGLVTGLGYDISPAWRIDTEFSYRAAYYQFAYRNQGSSVLNAFTTTQDQWISTIGVTYRY